LLYVGDFADIQAIYCFCNDDPPPIYVAVFLWARIFPRMMTQEQREAWTLDSDCQGIVDINGTIEEISGATLTFGNYRVKAAQLRDVLGILCKAKLAHRKSSEEYTIHFRRLRLSSVVEHEDAEELRLDHVKEVLIRAIVRGELPKGLRAPRIVRRNRQEDGKNQFRFPF